MPNNRLASSLFAVAVAASGACLAVLPARAHAAEFRSLASPAVLYDTPSDRGRKLAVGPRGMPLEVVLIYGEWTKVRDAGGELSWVESRLLTNKRQLIVNVTRAGVRSAPEDNAPLVFLADRHVLLEMVDPMISGWVKVRHPDGAAGFIRATEVWGE